MLHVSFCIFSAGEMCSHCLCLYGRERTGGNIHRASSRLCLPFLLWASCVSFTMTPPLWQKVKRNSKASWWKWKWRVKKDGLKLNIQKTNIMAPGPITLWEIDGETVSDFILGGCKITVDGDCSHEIKRHLLLERKVMTNLDSMLKSRDIILPTKVCLVKAMVFPVVMYGCESWTVKKAECRRIDAFELWG